MTYIIELATADDAAGVAKVMLSTTEREFSRLQRGSMPAEDSQTQMTERFRAVIEDPKHKVVIARAQDTGEIASVAQWVVHEDEVVTEAEVSGSTLAVQQAMGLETLLTRCGHSIDWKETNN